MVFVIGLNRFFFDLRLLVHRQEHPRDHYPDKTNKKEDRKVVRVWKLRNDYSRQNTPSDSNRAPQYMGEPNKPSPTRDRDHFRDHLLPR